ncbi:helix-turn-helix domain-containing protein [Aquimarina sp. BL5]|uniref:helix-turn-helix domain-containing protein n=1 Tax=Aquimarina sp. BL5 TaxID=1714860 RepID=UPI000E4EAFA6|nr:helix-turn-helix domain-containing protein [Aquimarina sp. BL5]AXT50198.1 helix-turn-helix domain-containing protein [Aquimarina sp. BL5]RKN04714.1 helix-turn-helix domain-containing protein [Aquimarina sp. BL5]
MRLDYSSIKDESTFILTDFNCSSSLDLLRNKGLYKIIWSKDHEVSFRIDGSLIELEKDQIVFCTPLNVLEIDKNTDGIISLVFNREFYCIRDHDQEVSCNGFLFFGSSVPQILTLNEKEKVSFSMMFDSFKEEFENKDQIQGEMLQTLLKRFLIKSRRLIKEDLPEPDLPNNQLDIIRKFNILIEQHFREKHQVAEYAELLFKSPKTLSNLFHKYSDKSPLATINERIVLEAKRLLIYSDKTSEEIAYELGYKEAGHFSKFFKKHAGMNPTEFKSKKLTSS